MRTTPLAKATAQVADLGWRQAVRSKTLWGVGGAIAFAGAVASVVNAESRSVSPAMDYQALQIVLLATVVVPFVSLVLGTGALATERENGTLAYLFTRPTPRAAVVLGKGLAAIAIANAATLVAVAVVYVAAGAPSGSEVAGGAAALLIEATALTSVFTLIGTVLARSLYLGLAYAVLVEGFLGNVVAARSGFTVSYHARNLLQEWSGTAIERGGLLPVLPESSTRSVIVLLAVTGAALAAAAWWVETREYGLKDRPKED